MIETLVSMLPPPKTGVKNESMSDWAAIESELGISFEPVNPIV
jgi:hypothetical protein